MLIHPNAVVFRELVERTALFLRSDVALLFS